MGFGNTGGSYGYTMSMDDLRRRGMENAKSSGGLGRKLFNILGGAEGDPSQHSGMSMMERGKSQAQNPGGLGKSVIRAAVKSYLGGGLGAVSDVGSVASDASGVMDTVRTGIDSARTGARSFLDSTLGPARNALGDIPIGAEGMQGMLSEKLGVPVGASAVQDFITEKTGIPIGGQAIVGKMGEMGGFDPQDISDVQTLMAQRDPQRKYGNVNQAMDPSEYMQPQSVGSRQINRQGGVRNLVAQRFGEGSPITQYIGAYDHGTPHDGVEVLGDPSAGPDSTSVILEATPGERIHVEPALQKVHPDYPGPHYPTPGVSDGFTPYPPTAGRFQGDVLIPGDRPETGLQKGLGWLSFIAGKFQGEDPWDKANARQKWNYVQDASRAIRNAKLQRAAEGKAGRTDYAGYAAEQLALNAMQAEMRVNETGVLGQIGQERMHPIGTMNDGSGRIRVQQQVRGVGPEGGVRWHPVEGGYEGPQQGEAADKSDDKILRNRGTQVAVKQWNPETRRKQFQAWNPETGELTWHDTPQESNWRNVQAGFGDAAVARLQGDDLALIQSADALAKALEGSSFAEKGGRKKPIGTTAKELARLRKIVSEGTLSGYTTGPDAARFYAIKQMVLDMFAAHLAADFPPDVIPKAVNNNPEHTR